MRLVEEKSAFTVITNSYLSRALLLAESLLKTSPKVILYICILDSRKNIKLDLMPKNVRLVYPAEESPIFLRIIFSYEIVEACTAVKPLLALHLMRTRNLSKLLYFDPDLFFYSRAYFLWAELEKNDFILTPHLLSPSSRIRGVLDHEIRGSLALGVFNLGFFGVKNSAKARNILTWWHKRLEIYCLDSRENALFTDQKWADFIPVFFENVKILKHPGLNVAPWNIAERTLKTADGKIVVGLRKKALIFYHFSGYDSGAHELMLGVYSENRVPLTLFEEYSAKLKVLRKKIGEQDPSWFYSTWENGDNVTLEERDTYREDPSLHLQFPDPWKSELRQHFQLYPPKVSHLRTRNQQRSLKYFKRRLIVFIVYLFKLRIKSQ